MAVAANKRSVMTLFSGPTDIYSHQVRIVLAEKGVSFEIEHVEKDNPPQDLIDLNPNQSVPTLVDRELTLWAVSRPKYCSRERWLITILPLPGLMKTRAAELLRRPVP